MPTPIRTTTTGKPAPFVPVKSGAQLNSSKMGPRAQSSAKGGAYMKKSKRKSMKKSRKSRRN
jgi:hypothetical protein